jgi:Ni/Fe-hydrogenase subunit HybB-like protein
MTSDSRQPPVSKSTPEMRGHWGYASVSDKISDLVLTRPVRWPWMSAFLFTFAGVLAMFGAVVWLFYKGIGIWGVNIPVAWGFAIGNFVWWIGIGHAGTFISAILLLLRQKWRTSINRFAEAMTLFAAGIAGIFPILHLGRPWFFYWIVPYPNIMNVWPQWRSPLVWDFFAIATYLTVSLLFWYAGLVPDLATLRDRAGNPPVHRFKQAAYGLFALGWRGEARHWARYETAYLLLAGLATPLVVSVHTIVSLDFAVGNTPGYHSTIFPPYFVAGALFSGFAMVLTLAIPLRHFFGLQDFITKRHLANAAKVLIVTSWLVTYGYAAEIFTAFYSGDDAERYMTINRWVGPYAPVYWSMMTCNVLVPQLLWWRRIRHNVLLLFLISLVINLGMWMERFLIVVSSLHRDFLPSAWGMFYPTKWDWITLFGSIALFAWLFLVFVRVLPVISIAEMREQVRENAEPEAESSPGKRRNGETDGKTSALDQSRRGDKE